jgi:hypothetical protein
MRNHIADDSAVESAENVLNFKRPPYSADNPGVETLDLVYEAAELIRNVGDSAAETQSRAETLAKQAIEMLKIAHARVESAESERRIAQTEIKEFSDRTEKALNIKLQEIEKLMEEADARIVAAEAQLSAAEQRARTAEIRANEAENALRRIEETIRTRILEKIPGGFSKRVATAA